MEPYLLGYFPRRILPPSVVPKLPNVVEIASVSDHCGPDGPAMCYSLGWWNEMGFFNTEALALKTIRESLIVQVEPDPQLDPPWQVRLSRENEREFDTYAYSLFPVQFVDGRREEFTVPILAVEPLSGDYRRLGCDAVNRICGLRFECSPLSCNGMASEISVNRYCLIDEPERAMEVACRFSQEKPEPGTYFVIEVWRKEPGLIRASD